MFKNVLLFFFFSSRRRHTRCSRDWSSDVCSSDLSHDYTPQEGITPALAVHYAKRLADEGVDGIEVSCGNTYLAPWNICRGDVPVKEILNMIPESKRFQVRETLEKIKDNYKIK